MSTSTSHGLRGSGIGFASKVPDRESGRLHEAAWQDVRNLSKFHAMASQGCEPIGSLRYHKLAGLVTKVVAKLRKLKARSIRDSSRCLPGITLAALHQCPGHIEGSVAAGFGRRPYQNDRDTSRQALLTGSYPEQAEFRGPVLIVGMSRRALHPLKMSQNPLQRIVWTCTPPDSADGAFLSSLSR